MAAHRGSAEAVERTPRELTLTPWSPLGASIVTLAIVVAAPLLAHLAARGYAAAVDLGRTGSFGPGLIDRQLMTYEAVYMTVLNAAMIALTLVAARRPGYPAATTLALHPPKGGWRAYALSLLIAAAATAAWFGVFSSWVPDLVVQDFRPYKELMQRERSWLMPPILCILAPVAEELLFRGFMFPALAESRLGFTGAAIVVSAAWTALHVDRTTLAMAQLFVAGLLLSWLLVRTGSLRVPMLCHVVFNTGVSFAVIVLGFPG
jgi:membrane protease YdiL (CAAX protease family)